MKIETISRRLNNFRTVSRYNNYYIDDAMYGCITVLDDFIFSYKIEIDSDNADSRNDKATLTVDCSKYNIHCVYEFFQYQQTVASIVDCILSILQNTKKMLLNIVYNA